MLESLSIRELHAVAQIAIQHLGSAHTHVPITANTPYLTGNEFRALLRLHKVSFHNSQTREWFGRPPQFLSEQIRRLLADDVPTAWCLTVLYKQATSKMLYVVPLSHLAPMSQDLARTHHLTRSYIDRLTPTAQQILQLLRDDVHLSYHTAREHCKCRLSMDAFYSIKRVLLAQERNFPWKQLSSR